jgi:hypothetical protein
LKSSVKAFREGGIFLREVDQIGRSLHRELMTSLPELTNGRRVGILFAREN